MSTLERIVPPVELCKQIPAGEFEDSALVFRFDHQQAGKMFPETNEDERFFYVEERKMVEFAQRNMVNPPPMFPAPTLEEILDALADLGADFCMHEFQIGNESYCYPTGVEEAILLWFEIQGIEVE